jgi:hypothetical protein
MKAGRLWQRHRLLTAYFLRAYSTCSGRVFSSKPFDHPFIISVNLGVVALTSARAGYLQAESLGLKRRWGRFAKSNCRCLYCIATTNWNEIFVPGFLSRDREWLSGHHARWRIREEPREFSGFSGVVGT